MSVLNQDRAPIMEALQQLKTMRIVPFDVPGHKRGKGNKELTYFLGEKCMELDVNSMKSLDNLCHPVWSSKKRRNWQQMHLVQHMPFLW